MLAETIEFIKSKEKYGLESNLNATLLSEKKIGLMGCVNFDDDVIKYIIQVYTNEAGVRKLKEILFEIMSEINLEFISITSTKITLPLNITISDIQNKYLKDNGYEYAQVST